MRSPERMNLEVGLVEKLGVDLQGFRHRSFPAIAGMFPEIKARTFFRPMKI